MKIKKLFKFLIIFLILAIFFWAGFEVHLLQGRLNSDSSFSQDSSDVILEQDINNIIPAINTEIKTIVGEIVDIQDNKILLKNELLDSFGNPDLIVRTVVISDNTAVFELVKKDEKQFAEELQQYEEKVANLKDFSLTIPQPYFAEEQIADRNKLKIGGTVIVFIEKDITGLKEFEAEKIVIEVQ